MVLNIIDLDAVTIISPLLEDVSVDKITLPRDSVRKLPPFPADNATSPTAPDSENPDEINIDPDFPDAEAPDARRMSPLEADASVDKSTDPPLTLTEPA